MHHPTPTKKNQRLLRRYQLISCFGKKGTPPTCVLGESVFFSVCWPQKASIAVCIARKVLQGQKQKRRRASRDQLKNVKSLFSTWQNVFHRITQGPEESLGPSRTTGARRMGSLIGGLAGSLLKFCMDMKILQAYLHVFFFRHTDMNILKIWIQI